MDQKTINNIKYSMSDYMEKQSRIIRDRGEKLYNEGKVGKLSQPHTNLFATTVKSATDTSKSYKVSVMFDKNGRLMSHSCTCPYSFGDCCKHIAAVMLAISKTDLGSIEIKNTSKKNSKKPVNTSKLGDIIMELDEETVRTLLLQYAEGSHELQKELLHRHEAANDNNLFADIINRFRKSIKQATDNTVADLILKALDRTMSDAYRYYSNEKYMLVCRICSFMISQTEYSANTVYMAQRQKNELSVILSNAQDMMTKCVLQIMESGSKTEKKALCVLILSELSDATNASYHVIEPALVLCAELFPTETERLLISFYRSKRIPSEDFFPLIARIKNDDDYAAFLLRYPEDPYAVYYLVAHAIEHNELDVAKQLCLDAIEHDLSRYGINEGTWQKELFSIYKAEGNVDAQLETAYTLLMNKEFDYYTDYKKLLSERGLWDSTLPELSEKLIDVYGLEDYLGLLASQKEYRVLLDTLETHEKCDVFDYADVLSDFYPDEVAIICTEQIRSSAKEAKSRPLCARLVAKMREFASLFGAEEVYPMIEELRALYPARTVFLEHLLRLETELQGLDDEYRGKRTDDDDIT